MKLKVSFFVSTLLLSFSTVSIAQNKLSDAEVQYFYKLIRETKEFNTLKATKDSANKDQNNVPQKLSIIMLRQDQGSDNNIFWAQVQRTIMGMSLESYFYSYDQKKKQMISVGKKGSEVQLN